MTTDFIATLREARARTLSLRAAIEHYKPTSGEDLVPANDSTLAPNSLPRLQMDIYEALAQIEQRLADGYAQAYADLADPNRVSWAGTAHEIREILATILRHLAPDDVVKETSWYQPESSDGRPSQKQRVKYILESRRASSNEQEVTEQVGLIEERIASLIRSTYSRASDAAHRGKRRSEAGRILNYFEAFAHDLLDLT